MNIRRYDLNTEQVRMVEDEEGEWVKYSDLADNNKNGSTKNHSGDVEESAVVGTAEGSTGREGAEPGSTDPVKDRWGVLYSRPGG